MADKIRSLRMMLVDGRQDKVLEDDSGGCLLYINQITELLGFS